MSFRYCVLGSGSSGNSVAVWDAESLFLIDAGFSCKETVRRLELAGLDPKEIDSILLSHEHSDHISGARVLHKRFPHGFFPLSRSMTGWLDWATRWGGSELTSGSPDHCTGGAVRPVDWLASRVLLLTTAAHS